MIDTITKGVELLRLYGDQDQSILPPLIKVQEIKNKGRGYIATQVIPIGTLLHIAYPLSTVVNQEWMPETCTHCFHFTYPKKLKIKAIQNDQDFISIFSWWQQQQTNISNNEKDINNNNDIKKKKKGKKVPSLSSCFSFLSPLGSILFCSEQCKQAYLSTMTSFEWYWWLTCVYRLEYFSSSCSSLIKCQQQDEVNKDEEKDQSYYYDFNVHQDDISLQRYLDQAWSIPPPKEELEEECKIDKNDLTLCRLIITCILKHYSEQQKQSPNNYKVSFDELWNIQDNELNYFRHHHPAIQTLSSAPLSWQSIPSLLQQHIKLYHFFETALYSPLFHQEQQHHHSTFIDLIPTFSLLEKEKKKLQQLFRSIFYREMANSFGLWEQQSNNGNEIDAVTDDLELLGYGIYPSAVYFNHSCHANVIKLRHGDQMHFYTKRDIQLNEELCISYGNVDTPFLERRQRLLDHYHFICQCQKCTQEEKDEKERKEKN